MHYSPQLNIKFKTSLSFSPWLSWLHSNLRTWLKWKEVPVLCYRGWHVTEGLLSTCIWEHLRTLHPNTSSTVNENEHFEPFYHQAQNRDSCIPPVLSPRTLPTRFSIAPAHFCLLLNHTTPRNNPISFLMDHLFWANTLPNRTPPTLY